jgi:pimeloyl-ACP methyl ester carboxylesterase
MIECREGDVLNSRDFQLRDIVLRADEEGPPDGPPILFLHGGGQTRHAWGRAVKAVAERGYRGMSFDLRGHGDSGWSDDGKYSLDRYAGDFAQVCAQLASRPVLVGASLGGLTGMCLLEREPSSLSALVLVDIVPRVPDDGAEHVRTFMAAGQDGFASVEEAAEAVSRYLPHRKRPRDSGGLNKNLRRRADGRYYWHWDPNMMNRFQDVERDILAERLFRTLADSDIPVLLVRGGLSRIVTADGMEEFQQRVPHAEVAEVGGADHMVAGDSNRLFNQAVLDFLERHKDRIASAQKM